ncbi:MAG: cytochrome c family protein [Chloroflexi bacterium]|nr:cytochrome c family protein [Chloroflexota bacterium]
MRKVIFAAELIIGVVAAILVGNAVLYAFVFPSTAPTQPIAFSHKLHAGDNGIPCLFCHIYATKSKVAGVPSVQKCEGCHASIKRDNPQIQKIFSYMDQGKPIPWVKVYNVADYVYFPHNRHLKAGVACEDCHGDVKNMTTIVRYATPGMGWCLTCHEKRNGPTDCWACHI